MDKSENFVQAADSGRLNDLKKLFVAARPSEKTLEQACIAAASNGQTAVLAWLASKMGVGFFCDVRARCCFGATRGGHLETLKYATNGTWPFHERAGFTRDHCLKTAKACGHREIEKWIMGPSSPETSCEEVD